MKVYRVETVVSVRAVSADAALDWANHAIARNLNVVSGVIGVEITGVVETMPCDECKAIVSVAGDLFDYAHASSCSLHPDNVS